MNGGAFPVLIGYLFLGGGVGGFSAELYYVCRFSTYREVGVDKCWISGKWWKCHILRLVSKNLLQVRIFLGL